MGLREILLGVNFVLVYAGIGTTVLTTLVLWGRSNTEGTDIIDSPFDLRFLQIAGVVIAASSMVALCVLGYWHVMDIKNISRH